MSSKLEVEVKIYNEYSGCLRAIADELRTAGLNGENIRPHKSTIAGTVSDTSMIEELKKVRGVENVAQVQSV